MLLTLFTETISLILFEKSYLHPFLYQCYSDFSYLIFNNVTLPSAEGIQRGDPLRPLCFSLSIQSHISRLSSECIVWYLDDGTSTGDPEAVRADFSSILSVQDSLGLRDNIKKCELSIVRTDLSRTNFFHPRLPISFQAWVSFRLKISVCWESLFSKRALIMSLMHA